MAIDVRGFNQDKLIKKLNKLEKSLINSRDENNALRAMSRKEARANRLEVEMLKCFEDNVRKLKPKVYCYKNTDLVTPKMLSWGNIVGMSDWHIGEEVDEEEVSGTNKFNYKESERRVKKFIRKIVRSNITKTENLIIADQGDNIRGIIHEGITDTEEGLMFSIVKAVEMQSMFIDEMLNNYNKIDYRFVVGNHSRLDDKIKAKKKYQDYSWLITKMLMKLYANEPRIKFDISKSGYHLIKLNTANILMFHGDTTRWYNPMSDSSVMRMQGICIDLFGVSAKHFLSGHTHIAKTIQNRFMGLCIVSGTLVGSNEYGVQSGFGNINVSQYMCNVDKNGDIEELSHFNLK